MNYRNLFQRYKNGEVNEKEKRIVETELERYEALEEFISESMDKLIDDDWSATNIEDHEEEINTLKKSVNWRLRKVVLTSVILVVVLYICIFQIGSGLVSKLYYDPSSTTIATGQENSFADFGYDMQAYVSLNMPGYISDLITFQESKGFGKYEVAYSLNNLFTDNEQLYYADLTRERLTTALDGIFSNENLFEVWNGFRKVKYPPNESSEEGDILYRNSNEKTLSYLNELNPMAYISLSIVFERDLTMEEFYNMTIQYPELNFKWVGIRTVEPNSDWNEWGMCPLIGFNPNYNDEPSTAQHPDIEKYPLFYLNDIHQNGNYPNLDNMDYPEKIINSYGIHFRSRLKYICDREDFVKIFDYNYLKTDFYKDSLEYIDENGINTYGVLVYGTSQDLLNDIKNMPYDTIYINDVLAAKPNIYDN